MHGGRLRRCYRGVRALLALTGMLVLVVSLTPLGYWWATWLAGPWEDPPGDVLIVLGASVEDQRVISNDTYRRSLHALIAWKQGGFREIIVCGSGPAELMKEFLVFSGIPAQAVTAESQSHSTRENALRVKEILIHHPGRRVLLTSDFHMFRAWRSFRQAGVDVTPRPIPDVRSRWLIPAQRWGAFLDLMLESGKIVYYRARGWI